MKSLIVSLLSLAAGACAVPEEGVRLSSTHPANPAAPAAPAPPPSVALEPRADPPELTISEERHHHHHGNETGSRDHRGPGDGRER